MEVAGQVMDFIGRGGLPVLGRGVAGVGGRVWLGVVAFEGGFELGFWGC